MQYLIFAFLLLGAGACGSDFVNLFPSGEPLAVTIDEDVAAEIVLTGTDREDDEDQLRVEVTAPPAHGALDLSEGAAPLAVTYTPDQHYNGDDFLEFIITDSLGEVSDPVRVDITIVPVNDLPVGTSVATVFVDEDSSSEAIELTGTDVEDSERDLTANVTVGPSNGSLDVTSGDAPLETVYTPDPNFDGSDSFTFTVTDSESGESAPVTVDITINPSNDLPAATAVSPVGTDEDTDSSAIVLTGTDVEDTEGDLTVAVVDGPANGTLDFTTGAAPLSVVYSPDPDYNGGDEFSFTVTDLESGESTPVTVTITVDPVQDAPVATALDLTVDEDATLEFTLSGTDADGDPLTVASIQFGPSNGTLRDDMDQPLSLPASAPLTVRYRGNTNYSGLDSFIFTVSDGIDASPTAAVNLTVEPVNDSPVGTPVSIVFGEDGSVNFNLTGTDVESPPSALTVQVVTPPEHGTLLPSSGSAPLAVTYEPDPDYNGSDSAEFTVTDPEGLTSTDTPVSFTINPQNDAPTIGTIPNLSAVAGEAFSYTPTADDIDGGDVLTFSSLGAALPAWASLDSDTGEISGTPTTGDAGTTTDHVLLVEDDGTPVRSTASNAFSITVEAIEWVAVGLNGAIETSPDGIAWTARAAGGGYTGTLRAAAYDGNGLWVAVGNSAEIQTSPGGATWTHRDAGAGFTGPFYDVAHDGAGLWVAVGQNGEVQTSPDGTTWTRRTVFAGPFLQSIAYDGAGLWVAVGSAGAIRTSTDTLAWTARSADAGYSGNFHAVAHDGSGLWVAVGERPDAFSIGEIQTSPDGTTWTEQTQASGIGSFGGAAYDGIGLWMIAGWTNGLQSSSDAIAWTSRTAAAPGGGFNDIAHNGSDLWIAVGWPGVIQTSPNGTTWTARSPAGGSGVTFHGVGAARILP